MFVSRLYDVAWPGDPLTFDLIACSLNKLAWVILKCCESSHYIVPIVQLNLVQMDLLQMDAR